MECIRLNEKKGFNTFIKLITLTAHPLKQPLQLTFVNASDEGVVVLAALPTDDGHDEALNDDGAGSLAYSLPSNSSDAVSVVDDEVLVRFWVLCPCS